MHGGELLECLEEALKIHDCFMISVAKIDFSVKEFQSSTGRMVFRDEFIIQSSFKNQLLDMRLYEIKYE